MIDYTISETVELPSQGKVYDGIEVNPTIRLKSMTTQHEMMRLSHSELEYQNLCDIIDDCMIDDPGISSYDMCLGDYQALLYKLRSVTYGPAYNLTSICPVCGAPIKGEINLDELPIEGYDEKTFEEARIITLPKSKQEITLRLQTPRLLDLTKQQINNFKKQHPNDLDPSIVYNMVANIGLINGEEKKFKELDKWLRELPAIDSNYLIQKADKFNSLIKINTELVNTCDKCEYEFKTNMRINSEFFRPNID